MNIRWLIAENFVLEIFRVCLPNITKLQKTKECKSCQIYSFVYFKRAINLGDNCEIISRKTNICPFNIACLHKSLYRITIRNIKSLFL